jgi:hypothetical protein
MTDLVEAGQQSWAKRTEQGRVGVRRSAEPQPVLDEKALLRDAARRLLCSGQLSTAELNRVLAMSNDHKPHPWTRSWVRSILIGFAIFAVWLIAGIATYQESPGDTPIIVALFSK